MMDSRNAVHQEYRDAHENKRNDVNSGNQLVQTGQNAVQLRAECFPLTHTRPSSVMAHLSGLLWAARSTLASAGTGIAVNQVRTKNRFLRTAHAGAKPAHISSSRGKTDNGKKTECHPAEIIKDALHASHYIAEYRKVPLAPVSAFRRADGI